MTRDIRRRVWRGATLTRGVSRYIMHCCTFGAGTCNCELCSELHVWLMSVFIIWYNDVIKIVPVFRSSCTAYYDKPINQRHSKTRCLGETNDTQRPNIWARPTTLKDPISGRDQRHSKTRCLGETSDTQRPNIWARPVTLKDPIYGRDQRHSKTQYLGETNDSQRPDV